MRTRERLFGAATWARDEHVGWVRIIFAEADGTELDRTELQEMWYVQGGIRGTQQERDTLAVEELREWFEHRQPPPANGYTATVYELDGEGGEPTGRVWAKVTGTRRAPATPQPH